MRRVLTAILSGLMLLAAPLVGQARPTPPQVQPAPRLSAGAAILMDWTTGRVLYAKDEHRPRDPASTTKILTALIVLERAGLSDRVTVSRRAASTPGSSMGIRAGETYSVHDLLHGLLLRSGNDAATALAEHVAGSVEGFAELMNQRAAALGARESHFVNPHGLTATNHVTSAYDLALIAREALRNPWFAAVVAQRERPLTYEDLNRDVVLSNTNRLLRIMPDADGVKTGTTAAAGPCLVASATRDEQRLVAVVLKSGNRWGDAANLLEWGFANWRLARLGRLGEVVAEARVAGGASRRVPVALGADAAVVLPRSAAPELRLELQMAGRAVAPLAQGADLGRARVLVEGEPVAEVPLEAGRAVARRTLVQALLQGMADALVRLRAFGFM